MDLAETLRIDLKDKSADVKLRAIMLYPHDLVARDRPVTAREQQPGDQYLAPHAQPRNQYYATYAQLSIESATRQATHIGSGILRRVLARTVPMLPEGTSESEADAFAAALAEKVARGVAWAAERARAGIERDQLEPAGGYTSLREAPGVSPLRKRGEANRKFGAACGEQFLYVVMMTTHHRDLDASMNRARQIMEKTAKLDGHELPPKRLWTTMWQKWQAVAPLYAAEALCRHAARMRDERWVLRESLAELIAVSHWLIDFGLDPSHVPKGSHEGPLLRKDRLVIIDCDGVPAREPEIPRLTEQQLAWARAYRSPAKRPASTKENTIAN
jgi:hypothetical protein